MRATYISPKPLAGLVGLVLVLPLLGACGQDPGTKAEFEEMLLRADGMGENRAECIADEVFDEYESDNKALEKLSGAKSWEHLTGEDGLDGFEEFLDAAVQKCAEVGPSVG